VPECNHDWVKRLDGYVETCTPAICTKCGKYGCWCDWEGVLGHRPDSTEIADFVARGINGNDHKLEKVRTYECDPCP